MANNVPSGVPAGVVQGELAEAPPAPKPVDKAPLLAHLKKMEDETMKYVGRSDFNPHLYVTRNMRALRVELATSHPATEDLAKRVMAVKAGAPPPEKKV